MDYLSYLSNQLAYLSFQGKFIWIICLIYPTNWLICLFWLNQLAYLSFLAEPAVLSVFYGWTSRIWAIKWHEFEQDFKLTPYLCSWRQTSTIVAWIWAIKWHEYQSPTCPRVSMNVRKDSVHLAMSTPRGEDMQSERDSRKECSHFSVKPLDHMNGEKPCHLWYLC